MQYSPEIENKIRGNTQDSRLQRWRGGGEV